MRVRILVLVCVALAACGKKGPPLPPLNLAPEAPQSVAARRLGDTVYIQFAVPNKSLTGPGPFSVDHLEVFAATIGPGDPTPPNRELLKPPFMVAKIPVQPPPDPDVEPDEASEKDTRPKPGDTIAYVEQLTPQILEPQQLWKPPVVTPKPGASPPPPAATPVAPPANPAAPAAAPAAPPPPPMLTRVYVVQGVAKNGSRGQPSARAVIPLLTAPAPARPGTTAFDASTVTITWQPPATRTDEAPGVTYNIYSVPPVAPGGATAGWPEATAGVQTTAPAKPPAPLNGTPIAETTFSKPGAAFGTEQCFVVRSVATVGTVAIESDPSEPMCVTPKDTFPPAAPKGLAAVAGAGVMNLIWDANTDSDLSGYIVLRGEAPGDTLQPLTPEPIRETRYIDRSVQPGVTYVYALIAVDKATPPNRSALSNKVQETAR